ncbi:hypothetical protein OV090_09645 [Nannocystis sp. RBIL2]|uniref:RCC1 domain-containing protein n=1 Tax=Nannocystis sp. RBIL2 TaxID=2996788 RepID=UPI00226D6FE9|nr:hypothetical protein [Nannocystis sp. RBIL2]MCY1065023.1 hypothetical protein [Nannocystis sp. RBIL2]
MQIAIAGAPALHGPVEALSPGRLWVGRIWGTLSCITTTAGRTGCWGSEVPTPLTGLATLPASARTGCLAAEPWAPSCAVVDASAARGTEVRALDDNPKSDVCALLVGGGVHCWGSDGRSSRVRGIRGAVEVAASGSIGCARLRDGAVKCWHRGAAARLRADVEAAVDLAVGSGTACAALRSGGVSCWQSGSAAWPVADLQGAVAVAVGEAMGCARLADGGVACWDPSARSAARRVPGAAGIVELKMADEYACGRDRDDGVWCWGDNHRFGLGDPESSSFLTRPLRVPGIPPAVDVQLGRADACARTEAGELWCWGESLSGVEAERPVPVRLGEGVQRVMFGVDGLYAELADGLHHLRARGSDGFARLPELAETSALAVSEGWGCAIQRGTLRCFYRTLPVDAVAPAWLAGVRRISLPAVVSLGGYGPRGCVALADGRAMCWGERFDGQGDAVAIDATVRVAGLPPVDAVAVGGGFACARTATGELWCWGDASEGRRGGAAASGPRRIDALPPVVQVAAGEAHACARTEAGELWCWGRNHRGQLGRGASSPWSAEPAPVQDLAQVTTVALARETSCAVVADGGVHCWGDNPGRHASPRGLLRSDDAVPVDPSRVTWIDAE